MARSSSKPKPQRSAGRAKGAAPAAAKAKKKTPEEKAKDSGPVGRNVSDEVLARGIKSIEGHRRDLKKIMDEAAKTRGYIRSEYKRLKGLGVNTEALAMGFKIKEMEEDGNAMMAWYSQRIAKVMNLPVGTNLDLFDPEKGGVAQDPKDDKSAKTDKEETPTPLEATVGLAGAANAYHAGRKAAEENRARYVPAKWKAFEKDWIRGYDDVEEEARKVEAEKKNPAPAKSEGGPDFSE